MRINFDIELLWLLAGLLILDRFFDACKGEFVHPKTLCFLFRSHDCGKALCSSKQKVGSLLKTKSEKLAAISGELQHLSTGAGPSGPP